MADLSKYSDDELAKLAKVAPSAKDSPAPSGHDFSQYSDEQLIKMLDRSPADDTMEKAKALGSAALKPVVAAGRFVDSYTGAPTRAAIGAIQEGKNPFRAFGQQFGSDPDAAPTGKQIAAKAGLSTEGSISVPLKGLTGENYKVSPAGIAGFGIDVVADPTNFVPMGAIAKGGARLVGKTAATAANFVPGGKLATTAIDATKESLKGAKLAVNDLLNPRMAPDFEEMSAIAARNGIDAKSLPEAIEFGQNSVITRAARNKAEGPLGQESLERFNNVLLETRDATERQIANIAQGPVLSKQEAGAYIRRAFDEGVDDFFSKVEVTHSKIVKDYPGLKLTTGLASQDEHVAKLNSALNGIEKFAKGRISRGISGLQEEQGRRLLKAVDAIRATNGSYKQTVEALRDIGEAAFKSQNTMAAIPADVERLRDLYGVINDALIDTVRKNVSPDVANELWLANKEMSSFIGNKNPLAQVIGNRNLSDEAVFRALVENGDSNKLQSLRIVLGDQRLGPVKGAWLDSLIKRDLDQSFTFKPIIGSMRNKRVVLDNLFEPNELKDFIDVVRLGDRYGNPILSTSGTGASNAFRDIYEGFKGGITNDAFIETAKRRAREAAIGGQLSGQSIQLPSAALKGSRGDMLGGLLGPSRGRLERSAKTSQVISSQDEERKARQNAFERRLQKK